MGRLLTVLSLAGLALPAADPAFENAERKLDLLLTGQAKPGSVISFPTREINAWARVRVPEIVPEGIRNQRVELGAGTATGFALIDFLKMRQAKGEVNWFLAKLIEGERPIKVSVRVESASGRATVYLTRLELSNVAVSGTALDFLIKTFFMPLYPDAKIDEPFNLEYNIEKIEVRPTDVRVTIKR